MGRTLTEEQRVKERERGRRYRSQPHVREYFAQKQRNKRAANPEKYRDLNRKYERRRKLRKYGLTEQSYLELLASQNNSCGICEGTETGSDRDWHVDHCHETGEVRGILCHHCNILLGNAKDKVIILQKAIKYLEKSVG